MRKYNDIYYRPVARNMVEEDGKIWMALINRNGICEVDRVTRRARICKVFEGEPLGKEGLYLYVQKVDKYLIFAPHAAEKIAVYNIEQKSLEYLPLKKMKCRCNETGGWDAKFWNIVKSGSDVYLVGAYYPAIIKVDTRVMGVTYITDWVEEIEKNIKEDDEDGYFSNGYVIYDDVILIPVSCMNAILEIDLKTNRTKLRKLDTSWGGIGGMASGDGENIWLVGRGHGTNRVCCWNRVTDNIDEIRITDMEENVFNPFHPPVCMADKIFLMPEIALSAYEIDIKSNIIKKSVALERQVKDIGPALWYGCKTMAAKLEGNVLFFITCDDLLWHEYNVSTGESESYSVFLEEDRKEKEQYYEAVYSENREENKEIVERNMSLDYFIDRVSQVNQNDFCRDISLGKKIYSSICEGI